MATIFDRFKNFNKEQVSSIGRSFYPPILDKSPDFAACFLTIADSKKYYEGMKEVYNSLIDGIEGFDVFKDTLLLSKTNFMWFASFFKKLEELLEIEEPFEIPYNLAPSKKGTQLIIQPPFHISSSPKHNVVYDKFSLKSKDIIDKHRINYIKRNLELEEFRDGFPAWYLMHETTIYEVYNEKTNVRVRIDFRNGEFRYFICGASDNWQEIMDVPLEMDHIVSALIFRN